MRPSDTSFSSASRATSRRTGSKHETTTVSGVSSMMTSTPVASSNARMLRPSRPMMRPFISSFGSETADTVRLRRVLGGDALDGERDDLLRLALGVALRRLANLANAVRGVGLRLLLHPAHQLGLRVLGGHAGQLLEAAALARPTSALELLLAVGDRLLAAADSLARRAELAVALVEELELAVEDWCRAPAAGAPRARPLRDGPRTSCSNASRRRITSSLPATTAPFREVSASRSASPTIRLAVSSAVAFASA